jgi:ferredoxin
MELGEPDEGGRRKPIPVEGAFETIDIDILVSAIGQGVDPTGFESVGLTKRRWIAADAETYATAAEKVFAAGDGAQGPETAVKAIANARKAAASINAYLGVEAVAPDRDSGEALLAFDMSCVERSEKTSIEQKPLPDRSLYDEDISTKRFEKIRQDAGRCFNCGCIAACPSDLAPALVALKAKIITTDRVIEAEDFFKTGVRASTCLAEGELVKEILLPKSGANTKSLYLKFRHRKAIDFPLFSVALVLTMEGLRVMEASIVLGAAAPVPKRAKSAEELMAGKELTEPLAEQVAGEALKDVLALKENGYKAIAAKAYVRRAVASCI